MRMRWRNLELPTRVTVDRDTLSDVYGKFIVEPFERGFGHTIGNGLRRVLLSSIEGTAVRWISVKGAEHEFQPVDGVTEDMTDIVLNVKNIKVRMSGDGPVTLRIRKSEKGAVTGADITVEGDAIVVNPEVHICTLNKMSTSRWISKWPAGAATGRRRKTNSGRAVSRIPARVVRRRRAISRSAAFGSTPATRPSSA